jgi:hypothetical protein
MTFAVMNSVGPDRAGMGSSVVNTSREVGGVFGVALLGALLTSALRSSFASGLSGIGLPGGRLRAIVEAGGHGHLDASLLVGLPPDQVAAVRRAFEQAFLDGFHLALFVPGILLLVTAGVAARWIPSRERASAAAMAPEALRLDPLVETIP